MKKTFLLCLFFLPVSCFAQFNIAGRVLNQSDGKPLPNVSIFLSNTTIGNKTSGDGTFLLKGVGLGKYNLVISMIGFETIVETINISDRNLTLPDILLTSRTIALNEITIKSTPDPERKENYQLFKDQFLGTSTLAGDCDILNPGLLDLYYDKKNDVLTASSIDFLKINNNSLGYNITYLLKDFKLNNKPSSKFSISSTGSAIIEPIKDTIAKKFRLGYSGSILFEEMPGTVAQLQEWKKAREKVYRGSVMHFLRSLLDNRLNEEGFKVLRLEEIENPDRPNDSLIQAKINFCKKQKSMGSNQGDSLSFWVKKARLPKTLTKLNLTPLYKKDIVRKTNEPGLFMLSAGKMNDQLFITYNPRRHFDYNFQPEHINNPNNKETTLVKFTKGYAIFDSNGWLAPDSVVFSGKWGVNRIPELLPLDYQPSSQNSGRSTEQGNPTGAVLPSPLKSHLLKITADPIA